MAEPPSLAGGVQLTMTAPLPDVPDTPVGASGTVAGVTDDDGIDSTPLPMALVAWTVKA
jgi:hypothetical protein